MTDTLTACLWRLSEAGCGALLSGNIARLYPAEAIDRLLVAGVLEELAPATEWAPCADCECALGLRPIRCVNGRLVACCPLDPGSDLTLDPEDLRGFRVDPERLLSLLGKGSGLVGPVEALAPGLWRIGRLSSGRVVAAALPARALRSAGSVLLLKNGGSPITVIAREADQATRLRLREAGIELTDLRSALVSSAGPLDRLDLARLEPKVAGGDVEAELIIRKGAATIEWRGATVGFTHQQFPVLLRLLEGARSHSKVASGPLVEDATGREAKDLIRELRQRVETAGFSGAEAKALIRAVHGRGYTLGVAPRKIVVEA